MSKIESLDMIDTQSEVYYRFKRVRSERANYFFNDEKGKLAYSIAKRFRKFSNPVLDYNGCYICKHIDMLLLTEDEWNKCVKIYNNACARRKRLKSRLRAFDGYIYFVTLTFTDEQLNGSSDSRRHNLINPFLKLLREQYGMNAYVGVKEYGCKTEREHYHFVMCFDNPLSGEICISTKYKRVREYLKNSVIEQNWKAIVNVSPVANSDDDTQCKLADYIAKVAGYLDKDTHKTQHLIYSSNFVGKVAHALDIDDDGFLVVNDDDLEFCEMMFGCC